MGVNRFRRPLLAASLFALFLNPDPIFAAPPGKAWAPPAALFQPGFSSLLAPRLDTHEGAPRLYATAADQSTRTSLGFAYDWDDDDWGLGRSLTLDPLYLYPVPSPSDSHSLVFVGGSRTQSRTLLWAEDLGDQVTSPEVIASVVREYETQYAGATSGGRRWAAIRYRNPNDGLLRVFFSDQQGLWEEVAVGEAVDLGSSMIALDDTTALIVWNPPFPGGLHWGWIRGNQYHPGAAAISTSGSERSPKLRTRPSGGVWLTNSAYSSQGRVWRFENGGWTFEQDITCNYTGSPFAAAQGWVEVSHDSAERPVIVWGFDDLQTGGSGVCASIPGDEGWAAADEIFRGGRVDMTAAARDRNGDAWVAWGALAHPLRWTHTYTTATAREPVVEILDGRPMVSWKLSEAAPGSWWAVMRQGAGGEFEEVARVQAGSEPAMSWVDESELPRAMLRDGVAYRIRRESVDSRYVDLGPIGKWRPSRNALHLSIRPQGPGSDAYTLSLGGVTGSRVELTIYDVAGRVVQHRELTVSGDGSTRSYPLVLGSAGLRTGLYFARVRDESGATSDGVKFVRLR